MSAIGNKAIFSKNLKYYIERSGKDRRELADIWGFPYSTVSEWVNGKKYPRIDRIEVMAEYFGIMKSDLIEDKMSEEKETPSQEHARDVLDEVDVAFYGDFKELTEDEKATVRDMVRIMRERRSKQEK